MYEVFITFPVTTKIFFLVILMVAGFIHWRYSATDFHYGPIILTMIGIFGCFLGIAIGLHRFDTNNLQGSVPDLLTGIKTSFWASVAGIGTALTVKLRYLFFGGPTRKSESAPHGATIDDLARWLYLLQRSLAGDEDTTLLSQVRFLRQETRDELTALRSSLDDYLRKMADNNSKALIDALREVIRDFNAKINEQFGDNFKELNSAVSSLVTWQETYRDQLAEMVQQQKSTAESMSTATGRYTQLVEQAERFTTTATELQTLLSALETQKAQLQRALTGLEALLRSAGEGIPRLEQRLSEMTRQIEAGVRSSVEQITSLATGTTQQVHASHEQMKRTLAESAEGVHREVNSHLRQLSEYTRDQVVALDHALTRELEKSITTLGRHLTALSEKFVEDYKPLTERLRSILQLGKA